jgi:hypothetical protein
MPSGNRLLAALVLLVALATLALSACGGDNGPSDTASAGTNPPTTPAPTTSVPPGGRQPTPDDPLRVTFAGDSVMAEFAPAMIEALEATGETEARFILTPSVARGGAELVVWNQELQAHDPDLVVLLMGLWEDRVVGEGAYGAPTWAQQYQAEVLGPFLDLVTGEGAQVLWVGMPAVRDDAATARFATLNGAFAAAADARDDVDYLNGGQFVSAPEGGYTDLGVAPGSGATVRWRRVDGHHLCPDGVVAIGGPVLEAVAEQWNVGVGYGWQQGAWRRPPLLHAPEECPAPA